jgi:hypothetical protein
MGVVTPSNEHQYDKEQYEINPEVYDSPRTWGEG